MQLNNDLDEKKLKNLNERCMLKGNLYNCHLLKQNEVENLCMNQKDILTTTMATNQRTEYCRLQSQTTKPLDLTATNNDENITKATNTTITTTISPTLPLRQKLTTQQNNNITTTTTTSNTIKPLKYSDQNTETDIILPITTIPTIPTTTPTLTPTTIRKRFQKGFNETILKPTISTKLRASSNETTKCSSTLYIKKTNKNPTSVHVMVAPLYAWLIILLCLIAYFGLGQAGFACLSNPCVFGVCIDGLNR